MLSDLEQAIKLYQQHWQNTARVDQRDAHLKAIEGTALADICVTKKQHVTLQQQSVTWEKLCENIITHANDPERYPLERPRGFIKAIQAAHQQEQVALIAELKKASPSKGVIREDFDPKVIAMAYERGGATCLSVLTDIPYFQGNDSYIYEAKSVSSLPVLRKDFIIDPYQLFEARAIGADAILLIMAALSLEDAILFEAIAHQLHMDVLIEVHNQQELQHALQLKSPLIGINNRNLKTLQVDTNIAKTLAPNLPKGYIPVCESGIENAADIKAMTASGIDTFLVGESLMRATDVEQAVRELVHGGRIT